VDAYETRLHELLDAAAKAWVERVALGLFDLATTEFLDRAFEIAQELSEGAHFQHPFCRCVL